MISSLIGAVIMSAVTVAMLIAIKLTDNALTKVGKYPLTNEEKQILTDAGFNSIDIENINQEIESLNFYEWIIMNTQKINNKGMTLPELVLAVLMLTAFTGVTVMVTKYTSRFFQPLNEEAKEEYITSEKEFSDVLNDNYEINNAFDAVIEIFSESGIDKNFILSLKCTALPSLEWNIPSIDTNAIPNSYKICIKRTSLIESSYSELLNGNGKPGIYVLYSKPDEGVSFNATPVRRIFCRPKPFCKLWTQI